MLRLRFLGVVGAVRAGAGRGWRPRAAAHAAGTGAYVLTATNTGKGYAPTFTGNGRLGIRVPATGQGYAGRHGPGPGRAGRLLRQAD